MKRVVRVLRQNNIFLISAAIFLYGVFFVEYFNKMGNLYNLLLNTSLYGIVAVGMTFVLLTGAIDISIGMQVALGSILACTATSQFGFVPGVLITLLMGAAVGYINGAAVCLLRADPFIVTLGTLTVLKGVGLVITNNDAVSSSDVLLKGLFTYRFFDLIPLPAVLFVLLLILGNLLLRHTRLGIHIYVIGGNAEAGRKTGVNVARTRKICFILAGVCASVGGIVLASRMNTGSVLLGENLILTTISSCVIGGISIKGGKGELTKMVAGVLIIQTVDNIMSLKGVPGSIHLFIAGLVLVIVLIIDRFSRVKLDTAVSEYVFSEQDGEGAPDGAPERQ